MICFKKVSPTYVWMAHDSITPQYIPSNSFFALTESSLAGKADRDPGQGREGGLQIEDAPFLGQAARPFRST